jgi:glycosyltransferase involved in cell wall biosynthesis
MKMRKKGITLAICTHNGRKRLEKTLNYILAQEVRSEISWELLVIDNASTDGTAEFVIEVTQQSVKLTANIIREETLGAIHARLRAVKEANFTYLSYVDDDNCISSNWVNEIYNIFESYPDVGIVSCPSKAHLSAEPPDYFKGFEGWLAVGKRCHYEGIIKERPMSFWTAGLSLRLEAFDTLNHLPYSLCLTGRTGNETYGGEDHEICLTLK